MSIFNGLLDWLGWGSDDSIDSHAETTTGTHEDCCCGINPATGLPMASLPMGSGCGGFDIEGNPFGTDLHIDHGSPMDTSFSDDDWSSISPNPSCWDD